MQVNIQELLGKAGLKEPLYPGKKVIQQCRQEGEYKSHCVVYDWRNPDKIIIEVKAGLSGRDLPPKELKKYPVSFQAPTFFEIDVRENKSPKKAATKKAKTTAKKGGRK